MAGVEPDPTIEEALQMRIAHILAGGYHQVLRRVQPELRRPSGIERPRSSISQIPADGTFFIHWTSVPCVRAKM